MRYLRLSDDENSVNLCSGFSIYALTDSNTMPCKKYFFVMYMYTYSLFCNTTTLTDKDKVVIKSTNRY